MTQEFSGTVSVRLPDEPHEQAEALSVLANEWTKFLAGVQGLPEVTVEFSITGVRPGNGIGRRRRRRRSLAEASVRVAGGVAVPS